MNRGVYWLLGLPCIGKTSAFRQKCLQNRIAYIEAENYCAQAWQDFCAANGNESIQYTKTFQVEFARCFLDIDDFVRLHTNVAPFLVLNILRSLENIESKIVVIEISKLYANLLPKTAKKIFLNIDYLVHKRRLVNRLGFQANEIEFIYWTLHLAEQRLRMGQLREQEFDISDVNKILAKLI